jgi:TonB family protein
MKKIYYNQNEFDIKRPLIDRLFLVLLPVIGLVFVIAGIHLSSMKRILHQTTTEDKGITTHFVMQTPEQKKPVPVKPILPKKKEEPVKDDTPVDLTQKSPETQKQEDEPQQAPQTATPVRKVYGLKKVYSVGLGSGGPMSSAVIGKLGNTLSTDVDTFKATDSELKGTVVSTATVTTTPKPKKIVKPEFSKVMLDNRAEGIVKVKVLIDIDGKVKKATVLSDIGFDSASQALKAVEQWLFEPALRGEEPVAVWIIVPVRFVIMS